MIEEASKELAEASNALEAIREEEDTANNELSDLNASIVAMIWDDSDWLKRQIRKLADE